MFISQGKITIKEIHGAHGRFCVGDLLIPEGQLKVKDSVLDQFEPGSYSGKFDIGSVGVQSYTHMGRVVTELRAHLNAIYIDEAKEGEADTHVPAEPDPAEDDPPPALQVPAASDEEPPPAAAGSDEAAPTAVIESEFMSDAERAQLAALGSENYALVLARAAVKLDPTVGRVQLRAQAAALKQLGYRFDGQSQTWHVAGA